MKRHPKTFLFVLLSLATVLFPVVLIGGNNTEMQQQKADAEEQETPYSEDEYNAYDTASKEANLEKRGTMLLEFIDKYPKSALMSYVKAAYENLLHECSQAKQYALLEPLAEKWLKLNPNNVQTLAYLAEAAQKLGNDQKYVQRLEEIYALDPKPSYAADILQTYGKIKNQAKVDEWTEKILKMPDYDANFSLRFDFVKKYMEANKYCKAADYARMTLKSMDLVKEPSKDVQDQMRLVRYVCHLAIGICSYESTKFVDAIRSLQQALKFQKHGEPYYYIGMSQWKMDKIEEALLSFARAELQRGDIEPQAKEKVEQLYKALHNNTTVGIEKIYRKAKEEPAQ
jgi:tetratricopeptide (TPR) repeat protein